MSSALAPGLIRAYRETEYHVYANPTFVLRVDQPCAALEAYYAQQNFAAGCFLTAWNPQSEQLGLAKNLARQQILETQLQQAGWNWLRALAAHPNNGWPAEPGCFIQSMEAATACEWGRQFAQNAIICCGLDTIPRLVLLR